MPKDEGYTTARTKTIGRRGGPDVAAMSDTAKAARKKKLEDNTRENLKRVKRGKKPRTIAGASAEKVLSHFRTPLERSKRLQAQAAKMSLKAKEVEASGTGNVRAAATYRKTAKGYLKQAQAVLKKGKK